MTTQHLIFGDCATLVRSSIIPADYPDEPYIALEHIDQGQLSLNGYAFGRNADSQKARFSKGDILFGKLRPYFRKAVIAPFSGMCSTDIWVVRPKAGIDRNFLFYWMVSDLFVNHASDASEGTRMPRAKWDVVEKIKIPFISSYSQQEIGSILRTIDDRIALLRETNVTLEAIAQALFKSWFVDFDPVRAKQKGREPEGMDADTAVLFPDSFQESELGFVPRGWVVKSLGQKFVPTKGKNITKLTVFTGDVSVVAGGLTPAYYHNEHNVDGPATTISASGANAGYVKLYHENIWASDCSYVSKRHTNHVYSMYLFLKSRQAEITHMQQGAAQPHVYPKDLMRLLIIDAPVALWDNFESLVSPFFKQIRVSLAEASCLSNLRDTLLPRLISGQLRLPDIEMDMEVIR